MTNINSYIAAADAEWRVQSVRFEMEMFKDGPMHSRYPLLYRNDITDTDDNWETEYQEEPRTLRGVPIELYIDAVDELGAFKRAQDWLDQHRPEED